MFKAHLSTRQDVSCQFDLGKVALADGFEKPVVADMRLLVGAGGDGVAASSPGAAGSCGTIVPPVGVRGVLEIQPRQNHSLVSEFKTHLNVTHNHTQYHMLSNSLGHKSRIKTEIKKQITKYI